MGLLANSNAIETGGYNIQRSLRFRSSASAYLSRTPASAGNRRTWTWSCWVKLGDVSGSSMKLFSSGGLGTDEFIRFNSSQIRVYLNSISADVQSSAVYRDPSAWYNVLVALDTTQATASNRIKIYVNGSLLTALSTATYPAQNAQSDTNGLNGTALHAIGASYNNVQYFDGYLAETFFIDGQALTPSSFGQTDPVTGVWTPKKYTGTYGTNGFYLPFSDNTSATTLAYDKSGNGNNWTPNNISTTAGATYDSMTDVPTLTSATAANFATLNPVTNLGSTSIAYSSGNLNWSSTSGQAVTTIGFTSGKFYAEVVATSITGPSNFECGIVNDTTSSIYLVACYKNNGTKDVDGINSSYGATFTTGDVIGIAVDADAKTVTFYKNNASQGSISFTTGGTYYFSSVDRGANTSAGYWNFGQRPFSYTPPTGFKALNTFNLPDPTIKKPNQYMDATTYTGTGSALSVTNAAGFQPDFVWVKGRSGATDHALYDAVRGVQKQLESNTTTAETTETTGLTAFNSNGFSVGALAQMNTNAATYVGWQWKKGATPGFDIVTYTGNGSNRTISHSLGVAPSMMIVKSRSQGTTGYTGNWAVWHSAIANTEYLLLNTTAAKATGATYWNSTTPTSSVFSLGTAAVVNNNNDNFVNYLFAEIAGFSKFGSYTGNGSTDGPFVYCGFRPKYILTKRSSTAGSWHVYDTSRSTYNVDDIYLMPNASDAESTGNNGIDILSNGFKLRSTNTGTNENGTTIIYAAFAENPFKYSLAR